MYNPMVDDFNQERQWSQKPKEEYNNNSISIKEYEAKTNPQLKGFGKQIVNSKTYNLFKWGIIILAIFVILFGYMAMSDKFKTEVSCPTFNCPDIPACPQCPSCPSDNISLQCGNTYFPDSLDINLNNETN